MRDSYSTRPPARAGGWLAVTVAAILSIPGHALAAQTARGTPARRAPDAPAAHSDSAFHALQARGMIVMGVDQYTSAHRFDTLPDGGRIVLERLVDDSTGIEAIRAHLRAVAAAFARGDFGMSRQVHAMEPPGARVLAERREHIRYIVTDLSRGAELRITTRDPAALRALREFLAFQNADHRTGHAHR